MTDQLPPWVPLVVALLLVVMSIVPVLAKLIPPRDAPPKTAADAWPVSVQALQYKVHEEIPAPSYCCDQGEIAWPYPCPWHPPVDEDAAPVSADHECNPPDEALTDVRWTCSCGAIYRCVQGSEDPNDTFMRAVGTHFVAPMDRVDS